MSIDPNEFRRVLGHFATGVAVVAARAPGAQPVGLTVSAVASVSLHPPLLLVCVDRSADSHDPIRDAGSFAVSILEETQEPLSRTFSAGVAGVKFDGVAWREERTGAPVLEAALAWADCRTWARYDGGDHSIFVGEVVAGDAREGTPLLYYRSGYGRYAP